MYLIFDTETTALPRDFKAPITDTDNWPRCVQIAWQLHDGMGNLIESKDYLIQPEGYDITFSEMSLADKNKISHRGKAVLKLASHLSSLKQVQ